jgi:hypothetical protein
MDDTISIDHRRDGQFLLLTLIVSDIAGLAVELQNFIVGSEYIA